MRPLPLTLALVNLALLLPHSRAQDAVLVLTPSATTTVRAGTGAAGFRGDGASASAAQLAGPTAMARDAQGNVYLADTRNHRIRRIAVDGTITTVAGTGTQGFAGDEGAATSAELDSPAGVAIASDGTLFVADTHNHRIRHIDSAGAIHTVAGTGVAGFRGDGDRAVASQLSSPLGLATGLTGDVYIADSGNHRVRHIDANGSMATVAGDGAQGTAPDGAQGTAAHLNSPVAVSVRPDGSVLIADRGNDRILALQPDGTLHVLNTASVSLRRPSAAVTDSFGETLIADTGNYRVARVSNSGAGSALGSGMQGALDLNAVPTRTSAGALSSVIDTGAGVASGQFTVVDRDHSQLLQVDLPLLSFPGTVVATASAVRTLLVRNAGTTTLSVAAMNIRPPFEVAASSCGAVPFQLAAGSSCSLGLVFTPQSNGANSGLLELDPVGTPPQRVSLLGAGLPTGTQLASSTSLQMSGGIVYAGTPLTMTAAVLGSSSAVANGSVDFLDGVVVLGSGVLNPSAQATFTIGTLSAGLHTLTARYSGNVAYLGSTSAATDVTVATPPDFSVAAASGNRVTVQSGSAGTLSLLLQPVSGVLNHTVTVDVSGLPAGSAINVTPVPVTLATDPVAVTIAFKLPVSLSSNVRLRTACATLLTFSLLCLRKRRLQTLLTAVMILPLLLQGCGGGYLSGTGTVSAQSAGSTYPVVVTVACPGVTGAMLTHSVTYTVVVQQ